MDKKGGDGYESAREELPKTMLEMKVIRDEICVKTFYEYLILGRTSKGHKTNHTPVLFHDDYPHIHNSVSKVIGWD